MQRAWDARRTRLHRRLGQVVYIAMLAVACGFLAVGIGLCGYQYYKFYMTKPSSGGDRSAADRKAPSAKEEPAAPGKEKASGPAKKAGRKPATKK